MSQQLDAGTPRIWSHSHVIPSSQGDTKVEDREDMVLTPRLSPMPSSGDRLPSKASNFSAGTGPAGPLGGSENATAQFVRCLSEEFRDIMHDHTRASDARLRRMEDSFERLENRVLRKLDKVLKEVGSATHYTSDHNWEALTPPVAGHPVIGAGANEDDRTLTHFEAKPTVKPKLLTKSSDTSLSSTTSLQYTLREVWTKRIRRAVSQRHDGKDKEKEDAARYSQEFLEMKIEESRTLSQSESSLMDNTSSINPYAPSASFKSTGCCKKIILHPSGAFRLIWDIVGMLLITYDCVTIPFFAAFDVFGAKDLILFMFWITLIFWTADIFLSFVTGYYQQAGLELRPKQIARHYLLTWFIPDVIVVSSDWVVVAFGEASNNARLARASKTVRAMRVLRSLRLLRLMKLRKIINDVQDHINSEYVHILLNIFKLLILIVFICHLIACLWYLIGMEGADAGWVSHHVQDANTDFRYVTSLHWSLTQFTPACTEVQAYNVGERIFSTIVLLFGLIIFSSFISSITTAMTRLKHLSSNADKQLSVLRRYLRQRRVSGPLSVRVQKYCEFMLMTKQQQIQEKDVAALKVLSLPLQQRLALETYEPILTQHLFFRRYCLKHRTAFQMICHNVLSQMYLSISDCLFSAGENATSMFFLVEGQCVYSWNPESILKTPQSKETSYMGCYNEKTVTAGQFMCEAALWVAWHNVGTLHSTKVCELILVSAEKFAVMTRQNKAAHLMSQRYARAFLRQLNDTEEVTDLTQTGTSGQVFSQKVLTAAFSDEVQDKSQEAADAAQPSASGQEHND